MNHELFEFHLDQRPYNHSSILRPHDKWLSTFSSPTPRWISWGNLRSSPTGRTISLLFHIDTVTVLSADQFGLRIGIV
jgi:hypothetical protein